MLARVVDDFASHAVASNAPLEVGFSIDLQGSYCYTAGQQCASSIPTVQVPVFISRLLKLSACCLLIG